MSPPAAKQEEAAAAAAAAACSSSSPMQRAQTINNPVDLANNVEVEVEVEFEQAENDKTRKNDADAAAVRVSDEEEEEEEEGQQQEDHRHCDRDGGGDDVESTFGLGNNVNIVNEDRPNATCTPPITAAAVPKKKKKNRKPKWWRVLSGRRATKSQRATMARMFDLGYGAPRHGGPPPPPVGDGTYRDLGAMFGARPRRRRRSSSAERNGNGGDLGSSGTEASSSATGQEVEGTSITSSSALLSPTGEPREVWLEIGFGQGENLLTNARNHPGVCHVGADVHQPGACAVLGRMEDSAVKRGRYWDGEVPYRRGDNEGDDDDDNDYGGEYGRGGGDAINTSGDGSSASSIPSPSTGKLDDKRPPPEPTSDDAPQNNNNENNNNDEEEESSEASETSTVPYDNVRIYPGDGVKFLGTLPPASLSVVLVPFPDPFPKLADASFRVVQPELLLSLERVLKPGGLFYLATDSVCFDEWCVKVFEEHGIGSVGIDGRPGGGGGGGNGLWERVQPTPAREGWLPVISRYEVKGLEEGRSTRCRCWRFKGYE